MATDKKSDYPSTSQEYTDWDGNRKNFTIIDHDKKPTISAHVSTEGAKEAMIKAREELVGRILSLPASAAPFTFVDFTVRGDKIVWNERMIRDEGVPFNMLRDLCTLTENRMENNF